MKKIIKTYHFFKTKYGQELLIDLIRLESLESYLLEDCPHKLSYFDITLIANGQGTFALDQHSFPIEKGRVFFTSPGQVRLWDIIKIPKGYVLIFEEEFLTSFFNDSQFVRGLKYFNTSTTLPQLILSHDETVHLISLFEEVEMEIGNFNVEGKHILRALLYQVLVLLNRKYIAENGYVCINGLNRHIQEFSNKVNILFAQHHSVAFYANVLNITPGHLNYLCKIYLGIGAKQFIQNKVILESKKLLIHTNLSVTEVARQLNFDDGSYFVRLFKIYVGTTPLLYRKCKNP